MALVAAFIAMLFPSPAVAGYETRGAPLPAYPTADLSPGGAVRTARTAMSDDRPSPRYRAKHKGCNSAACDRRVARKARAKTNRRWRKYTAPYRGWLKSTGDCETRGLPNDGYTANTGNGFYGRYQFTISTWGWVGGDGYPHQDRPLEQDYRAVKLLKRDGPGHWPVCG